MTRTMKRVQTEASGRGMSGESNGSKADNMVPPVLDGGRDGPSMPCWIRWTGFMRHASAKWMYLQNNECITINAPAAY